MLLRPASSAGKGPEGIRGAMRPVRSWGLDVSSKRVILDSAIALMMNAAFPSSLALLLRFKCALVPEGEGNHLPLPSGEGLRVREEFDV